MRRSPALVLDAVPRARRVRGRAGGTAGRPVRVELAGRAGAEPIIEARCWSAPPGAMALVIEVDGRQAIVAPMMAFGRSAGCVWAETSPGAKLDAGHVRLLLVVRRWPRSRASRGARRPACRSPTSS